MFRHNYWIKCNPNGHGTEQDFPNRGMRSYQVYDNIFDSNGLDHGLSVQSHRSGSGIWHDNTFLGPPTGGGHHSSLSYYRNINGCGKPPPEAPLSWGVVDGATLWDKNEPGLPVYKSGTVSVATGACGAFCTLTISGGGMTQDQYKGYTIRNDTVGNAFHRASQISGNSANTITYFYTAQDNGVHLLKFAVDDSYSIRRSVTPLDLSGHGKGDFMDPTVYENPNQQIETCFSWNNKNADNGQVLGFGNNGDMLIRESTILPIFRTRILEPDFLWTRFQRE